MKALLGVVCAVFFATILCASASPARAALQRPNAMDKVVDAIPARALLGGPARSLADPDRQAAAARLVRMTIPGWIAMVLFQIFALAYFWRSGAAAAWRDRLRRAIGSEFLVRFLFGATLGAIARLAALVPDFYLYRVDRLMGLSSELSPAWSLDMALGLIGAMLLAGAAASTVLWIADRTHQWYVYTAIGFVLACLAGAWLAPVATAPLYNRYQNFAYAYQPGETPVFVENRSQRAQTQGASYEGLWGTTRIVISDTAVAGSTQAEVRWLIALEKAHVADGDPLRRALLQALVLILGATLGVFVADRIGFRRDDDPVSRLALVGAIFAGVFFLAVPVYNVGLRAMEAQADVAAAKATPHPEAAIRALIRRADENLEGVDPGPMAMLFFQGTPSIAERVGALNGKN